MKFLASGAGAGDPHYSLMGTRDTRGKSLIKGEIRFFPLTALLSGGEGDGDGDGEEKRFRSRKGAFSCARCEVK